MTITRFGVFDLDLQTGELRRRGVRVKLQEQPFEVLALLVSRHGDLVSRDEVRTRLWPRAVFVDFDHGVTKAIAKIRRALGDSARSPHYVETLPKRGYRFIARIEVVDRNGMPPAPPPAALRLVWDTRVIALSGSEVVIGRDPEVAVCIGSPRVSRRHARIVIASQTAVLEDLGSKNGTFVNDQRINRPVALADKDTIRIGPARMIFHSSNAADSTETASHSPSRR